MIDSIQVFERFTRLAPLGVRFWDTVSGTAIGGGLSVTAYPAGNPAQRVRAFANRSGIYIAQDLPGMRALEYGAGDKNFWDNLPPRQPFILEAIDMERRFQPFLFKAELPARGLFPWICPAMGSPLSSPPAAVPLYSAPARSVPAGMAVIRADLWDPVAAAPAAWATIEVRIARQPPACGIADAVGRMALIFPYPEPNDFVLGSPLGSPVGATSPPLARQQWPVQLRATYARRLPVPPIPDLCATLTQPPATLWADAGRTQALRETVLPFGRELVLRSRDVGGRGPLSVLFITPAGSPP